MNLLSRGTRHLGISSLIVIEAIANATAFSHASKAGSSMANRLRRPAFFSSKESSVSPVYSGARTALSEMSKDGAFKRSEAAWRNWISRGEYR